MISENYLDYDVDGLKNLNRFLVHSLVKKEFELEQYWIENKKCKCVNNLKEGIALNCKHFNNQLKKRFENEGKRIKKIGDFALFLELYNNPNFPNNWLHRLKL